METEIELKDLESIPIRPGDREAIQKYVRDMQRALGDDLKSIILYGSAVKDNFFPGSSDINLMVVVPVFTTAILKKAAPVVKGYSRRAKISTLLVDKDDVGDATDVFPIRYLDIKNHHRVLLGPDIFEKIEIDSSNLRFDLERQVRGVVHQLRDDYMHSNYTVLDLRKILVSNFSGFSHFLSTMIYLNGSTPPVKKQEIVEKAAEEFNLNLSVLEEIVKLKRGGNNPPRVRMLDIFERYLDVVDEIVEIVDKMVV